MFKWGDSHRFRMRPMSIIRELLLRVLPNVLVTHILDFLSVETFLNQITEDEESYQHFCAFLKRLFFYKYVPDAQGFLLYVKEPPLTSTCDAGQDFWQKRQELEQWIKSHIEDKHFTNITECVNEPGTYIFPLGPRFITAEYDVYNLIYRDRRFQFYRTHTEFEQGFPPSRQEKFTAFLLMNGIKTPPQVLLSMKPMKWITKRKIESIHFITSY